MIARAPDLMSAGFSAYLYFSRFLLHFYSPTRPIWQGDVTFSDRLVNSTIWRGLLPRSPCDAAGGPRWGPNSTPYRRFKGSCNGLHFHAGTKLENRWVFGLIPKHGGGLLIDKRPRREMACVEDGDSGFASSTSATAVAVALHASRWSRGRPIFEELFLWRVLSVGDGDIQ